ncbi:tetratricopeptide repeat protein [Ktedonobacteria bacterium brp13]|nr:tetratricopeptide repeat protein [Ktedonobacteria bacterium brp13]
MSGKKTYHQQVSYCGKPRCKRCRDGVGHGPYWYAYQTVDGRTMRTYIGKHLPPEAQADMLGVELSAVAQSSDHEQVVRVYTLGQFRLERRDPQDPLDWQTVTDSSWQQQRVRALLGCLVSVSGPGGRKLGREQIIEALWPDLDAENGGSRLDRAVYSLRQVFEPGRSRPATSPLLLTERDLLVLADHPRVWIDADIFEQKISQAHDTRLADDPGQREQLLKEAAALYGGEFLLEDQRNEWTRARRDALQRSYIGLLLELADLMIKRSDLTGAIDPLDKLIAVDSTNEAGVQRLMIVLDQLGRRGEAMRAFRTLVKVLQRDYNIMPLPETRQIYEELRRGNAQGTRSNGVTTSELRSVHEGTGTRDAASGEMSQAQPAQAVQIGRAHQSPLVGRESELEQLRELVQVAEYASRFKSVAQRRSSISSLDPHRRPQCILLMGEVGIGKTRLAEELGREVKKRGWAVAWSRVYAQEGTIPYRLWIEVMRKAMEQGVWQRQEVTRRPLVFQPLGALLPELYHNKILPAVELPVSLSPEQEQLRLWEASRELISLISESTPLLIVLDDLQWADSSSCELLAYLTRRTYSYPIIIVGTCRENELAQNHPLRPLLTDLRRENVVQTVSLDRLSDEHISSLVENVSHVPEDKVQQISSRAAGNPFFAEELARIEDLSGYELSALPDTIAAVLTLRLGRLGVACQRLLSKAAVLGGSFEFQVISAMEASAPNYDEDTVLELLEEGLSSGMLTEEGTGTRITYQFWHPLLSTHLYEHLSAARRANLHRNAAEVMRKLYKNREEENAVVILHHLVEGGADEEVIAYYAELAGNRDCELSSFPAAENHYRTALDNLGLRYPDWARLSFLLERLGEIARFRGEFDEARHWYSQALDMILRHGSKDSSQYQQEAQVIAMLLWEIGAVWYSQGDLAQTRDYNQRAIQVLREADTTSGLVWAKVKLLMSYVYWREGNYNETRQMANEALEMFTSLIEGKVLRKDESYFSLEKRALNDDSVDISRIYAVLGTTESSSGRCSDALSLLNKALAISEQYNCQREIALICTNMGDLYLRSANYSQAQSCLRRAKNIAEFVGDKPLVSVVLGNMGVLDIRTGNLKEALNVIDEAILVAESTKDQASASVCRSYLGLAMTEFGDIKLAEKTLYQALTICRRMRISPYIGLTLVHIGYLRLMQSLNERNDYNRKKSLVLRAHHTLVRAIGIEGIEEETRVEGRLILAQVLMQQNEYDEAYTQTMRALEEATRFELAALVARAYHLLGAYYVQQKQYDEAKSNYERGLSLARKYDMRLELARELKHFGEFLLQSKIIQLANSTDAQVYLDEARQLFEECGAKLDLQAFDRSDPQSVVVSKS